MSTALKSSDDARRPRRWLADVRLPRLDLHRLWRSSPGEPRKPWRPGWGGAVFGAVVLALILFLALFDWNWMRGPIGRFASARLGREVRLLGDLKVHLLTLTPHAEVGGLTIANAAWGPKRNMADVGQIAASVKLLPLLIGRVEMPLVSVRRPDIQLIRDAQGRANWDFSNGRAVGKPFKLPPIQTFIIDDGKLQLVDAQRKLSFNGTINANEQSTAAYEHGFRLTGKGELNGRAFLANVTGGPLINVRTDRPYPFDAQVTAGSTQVTARGQVPKPFDLGVLNAAVSVQGRDLNQLYDLTGLALPNTPPYRVSGQLRRVNQVYYYDRFSGRVGASDINGDASVDVSKGRPFLRAKLNSRLLDFADLAGLFGAPGASKAAAPEQKAQVAALTAQGRLLPDATLQTERIRSMDAKVSYTATQVKASPRLPLRGVTLGVDLDHGLLKLDPISFQFPSGRLSGIAAIDARGKVPLSTVDLRVAGIRLEQFLAPVGGRPALTGTLLGRARLSGTGNSVHKAAANANGAVTAVIPRGQIRQAFAELLGIDATKGLFLLLAKDQTPTDVRCALADFKVANGVMTAERIVFDTGVVLVNGSGSINLDDETLDLRLKGQPKKLRAVRLAAPITVGGRLAQPRFGIDAAPAVAQAGLGVAIGALLSPLAAILPFVSPGLEKDADCAALFAQARESRAKVAAPADTTAPPSKGAKGVRPVAPDRSRP